MKRTAANANGWVSRCAAVPHATCPTITAITAIPIAVVASNRSEGTMTRQKLKEWGSEPIYVPRWLVTVKYAFLTLLGVAVAIATAPSIDKVVSSEVYSSAWGSALTLAGILAVVGSTTEKRVRWEKVGCTGLVALLTVYAISPIVLVFQGDMDRLAYSVVAVTVSVAPFARLVQLIRGSTHG